MHEFYIDDAMQLCEYDDNYDRKLLVQLLVEGILLVMGSREKSLECAYIVKNSIKSTQIIASEILVETLTVIAKCKLLIFDFTNGI